MQTSNSNNSTNQIYLQPQQMTYQNNNDAQEDDNLSLSRHQINLFYKQDNQINEITSSQQNSLYNTDIVNFSKQIQIFVQMPNGRTLTCDVNKNEECLQQIVDLIQKREGIPPNSYRLYSGFKYLNKISNKSIKKYQTLHLNIKCSNLNNLIVIYNNQRYNIFVNLDGFVIEIKNQLQKKFDFPTKSQVLYFKDIQIEDNFKLSYYQIQKHSTVELQLQNLIYINQESQNRLFMNYLDIFQTIKYLKTQLNQQYPDLGYFHLLHNNVILQDKDLLKSYNIKHLSILKLVEINYIKFQIQTQTITFQIKKKYDQTIYDLKEEIEQKYQYSIDTQQLFYEGEELENQEKIFECNIQENSRLYLFNNLKLIVNCINFNIFPIIINPNNKVYKLKQKINKLNSQMLSDYFILKYNGKILNDDEYLQYYNIKNFDYIFMEFEI
ncbi:unnamed protein product [Paramecium sonneborni]|uniref:Ubiquitin-like domain-containing protein n=1 Tax=Paramecium sonneborni TaxID=65129 RepID=A0A8S1QY01_9CILI|nr:unnamed protein product [Paramecium sonneborni]